jgi:hypothetical protein
MVFSGFLFGLVVGGWDFGFSGWGDEIPDRGCLMEIWRIKLLVEWE